MEALRRAVTSISSTFKLGPYSQRDVESQADGITKLVESGKRAAENGEFELAERNALQAIVGAREAKDSFLQDRNSPYTKQQLADWFGTCAFILNSVGKCVNAARCFYTATVFDHNWTLQEHVRVGGVLWSSIFAEKTDEFKKDFRIFLSFLHGIEENAALAERFERWEVGLQISMDVFLALDDFARRHRVGSRNNVKDKLAREALMTAARCALGLGNHQFVRQFCHRVLEDYSDYNDSYAFEVWGKSLFKVGDYQTARKKIELALNYGKDEATIERLEIFLAETVKHIKTPAENTEADPDWLVGTEAERHAKETSEMAVSASITPKKKQKHKRPKARERTSKQETAQKNLTEPSLVEPEYTCIYKRQTTTITSKTDAGQKDAIDTDATINVNKNSKQHRQIENGNTVRYEKENGEVISSTSSQVDLSDFDSDSDESETSVSRLSDISDTLSKLSVEDVDETPEDDTSTFYELSCRFHGDNDDEDESDDPKDNKLLREGLQLNASFLHAVKSRQSKGRKEPFYDEPLTPAECEQRAVRQPNKFKRCSLHIEGSHLSYCTPVQSDGKISVIEISGRSKTGRTFNEDEVLVEILDVEHEEKDKRYGKVVGVFKREKQDVKHPVFVCTLDDMESLVRPMCKTVPKVHILHDEILKRFYNQRKNKIELYDYNHRNGTLEFSKIIDINRADRDRYVFLVALLQWESQQTSIYPIGAVIRILPCGDTISHGLKILDLQHEVPSIYSAATVRRLESVTRRQTDEPPESLTIGRHDLCNLDTFTIDPPGSKDLDDALSIEKLDDGFRVGVHIADVSSYVIKGDAIDIEARERAVTFYPGVKRPRHMLPEPLSQNICSLVPNKRRLCISVFHFLDTSGELSKTEIKPSLIKSRRQFTYTEVQEIIKDVDYNDGLSNNIRQLHRLAEKRRRKRLGNSMFAVDLEADDFNEDALEETMEAHYLVEEFMVLTNWKVAKHLVSTFPELVPLRCQPPPSTENLNCFMKNESSILNLVLKLQDKPIHPPPSLDRVFANKQDNDILIHKWLWDLLTKSPEVAARYIKMDELHPLQYLAYQHWLSIQEHAFYKCSGSLSKEKSDGRHFSLKYYPYTHFTSPIRRYIDVVVHRLVHCMLQKQKMAPYNKDEVEKICLHVNSVAKKSKAYEKGCKTLRMSIQLKSKPKMLECFVDEVSDKGISLCAPDLKYVSKIFRQLPFNLLDMGFKPEELKDTKTDIDIIRVKWRKRLYDITGNPALLCGSSRETLQLVQYPAMMFVRAWDWAKLLKCVLEARLKDCQTTAHFARCLLPDKGLEDVNTETRDVAKLQPSTTFSLSFTRGQSLKIQMTADAQKGILSPKPQLYSVTKSFKCCLQHTDDPVMHLSSYSKKSTLDKYKSIGQYLDRWTPLVLMEAAVGSVSNEDTCTVNNVPVKFTGRSGQFSLPLSFCDIRNIEFGGIIDEGDEDDDVNKKAFDFLCIKYTLKREPATAKENVCPPPEQFCIGHGQITKVFRKKDVIVTSKTSHKQGTIVMEKVTSKTGEGKVSIGFDLHPISLAPPSEEADEKGKLRCGIEILIKSEVDRRTEVFLKKLPEAKSSLAERIALNDQPFNDLDREHGHIADLIERDLYIAPKENRKPLPRNNKRQQEAIDKALGSSFSLIQGPPGTGKTYTGIKLLYLFNKINKTWHKEGNERKQVLFCGPSNKSVDLVARWMIQRLGQLCPKVVRVYGRSIEAVDFPIPGKSFLSKRSTHNAKADEELQSVALHHLIRQKGKPSAEQINAFDRIFQKTKYEPDPVAVKQYLKLLRDASIEELKKHEVILCTTAVASNPKIREGSNIFQIIIDESGMCPEPHCLVPIIANKAEQVVLIGDHKQLRPIIMCKEAAELGLEKSLFERYWLSKSAQRVERTMLNIQYRMNPQLCRFPSNTFYHGKLKTENGLWAQGRTLGIWTNHDGTVYPHVLIHVEGEEKVLTVSTEDGNEQSKSNDKEIDQVVKIYSYLINEENIPANMVNVISQYNAQCSEIKRRLADEAFENFKVNTVVSSQGGEWDYVIFSTVRSLPEYKIEKRPTLGWCKQNLGFITDQNQINVALTRARKGLIIIGNTNLLRCDEVWGKLVKHYEDSGCIKSPEEFPPKKSRQEKLWTAIEMSEQKYGDERYIKEVLPDLGPYMPSEQDRRYGRPGRSCYPRPSSQQENYGRQRSDDTTDGEWEQVRPRRK